MANEANEHLIAVSDDGGAFHRFENSSRAVVFAFAHLRSRCVDIVSSVRRTLSGSLLGGRRRGCKRDPLTGVLALRCFGADLILKLLSESADPVRSWS